jgi:pheromone shutdown-related protein TraB
MSAASEVSIESAGDVRRVSVSGREFVIVGTAHISRESADLVRKVIERERPDCVCIELDGQRFAALSQKQRFDSLDLKQVIRNRQLAPLLANLVLAAYQKKLGGQLGVTPGTELLEAARAAEALGIAIELCDRDVRVTLRRAWAAMGFWKKNQLLAVLLESLVERPELDEAELRRLRSQDVLSELMKELGEAMPEVKRVLIDERDAYLAERMRNAPGRRIVAVVGAGHVAGILEALRSESKVDLVAIDFVPPPSPWLAWLGWGIPALIVGGLAALALTRGGAVASESLLYWIVAAGVPTTVGAAAALGHPLTICAAFFVAPVTGLLPMIGAGHVLAFLQTWLAPPLVSEFERVTHDVLSPARWWGNRLLRVFLVFVLTTLGSMLGNWIGGAEIVRSLL